MTKSMYDSTPGDGGGEALGDVLSGVSMRMIRNCEKPAPSLSAQKKTKQTAE